MLGGPAKVGCPEGGSRARRAWSPVWVEVVARHVFVLPSALGGRAPLGPCALADFPRPAELQAGPWQREAVQGSALEQRIR